MLRELYKKAGRVGDAASFVPSSFIKNRSYFLFLLSVSVSFFAWQFYLVSMLIIARKITGKNMADLADTFVLSVSLLPPLLLFPVAGYIIDRFNRRKIVITSKLCNAAVAFMFLIPLAQSNFYLFICFHVVATVFFVFFIIAKNSLIPSIYKRDDLAAANVLINLVRTFMLILGALLGGLMVDRTNHNLLFLSCACLHLLASVLLRWVHVRPAANCAYKQLHRTAQTNTLLQTLLYGLAYLKRHRYILLLVASRVFINMAEGLRLLYIAMATEVFALGDQGLGFFAALHGAGFLVGSLVVAKTHFLTTAKRRLLIITQGLASMGVGFVLLGLLGHQWGWLGGICVVWIFAGSACVRIVSITLIHRAGHTAFFGRVFAADTGISALAQLLITLLLGLFLGPHSVVTITILCGVLFLLVAAVWHKFAAAYFDDRADTE